MFSASQYKYFYAFVLFRKEQEKKRWVGSKGYWGGGAALAGTREYKQSESWVFEVLWNLECPV